MRIGCTFESKARKDEEESRCRLHGTVVMVVSRGELGLDSVEGCPVIKKPIVELAGGPCDRIPASNVDLNAKNESSLSSISLVVAVAVVIAERWWSVTTETACDDDRSGERLETELEVETLRGGCPNWIAGGSCRARPAGVPSLARRETRARL